jgi:putative acetyltransferase
MHIQTDDLTGPAIHRLLEEHLQHMRSLSPPESVHALDLDALRRPEITFWTIWSHNQKLMGSGALKSLGDGHGEIKCMRTAEAHRGKGVGQAMLDHILVEARKRTYTRLSLETGPQASFEPAVRLYSRLGFTRCGPFAGYAEDPYSVFMTMAL